MTCRCDWKRVYTTLTGAEDAYWRTPATRRLTPHAFLLPYWCEDHGGYHLGHFDTMGRRAYTGWGRELYNVVNAYKRPQRKRRVRRLGMPT